jgi:hypothetical protein
MQLTSTFYNYWDYWNLYHKVTFDGPNKLILINEGVTELDVKEDIYSDWKEWLLGHDSIVNAKYLEATESIGGQPLPGSRFVGSTFFLVNGWRLKPYAGSYTLVVNGNLYTDVGDSPYVDANVIEGYPNNIRIESTVSTLVETVGVLDVDSVTSLANIAQSVWEATLSQYASGGNAADTVEQIRALTALIPAAL